ncbi:hypothetical protein B0I35DRAFT_360066 [Stachybotrys elegans]|uniref:Uncharacterized protein n=1 Tax=Stachybotrys elegans TaxID=80388 RepID=A0A8K0SH92_9HYPO|nr:hypothetical protein B0I35DRAFT_360066 [Stachybotrys elegans]
MSAQFEVSPEQEGRLLAFLRRQLFSTPDEVSGTSLEGKTAIVTGSNIGVGFACSRQLFRLGISRLILAVRSEEKGKAAADKLHDDPEIKSGTVEVWPLDLTSYPSVEAFAERAMSLQRMDIVILNAAIMPIKQTLNPSTGHDEEVQVNYLSTVLLLILLLQVIKDKTLSHPSRITIVSTDAAAWTSFKEKDNVPLLASLDKAVGWDPIDRHFVSKLLMQLFVAELTPYVPSSRAVINMATPGLVHDTGITRHANETLQGKIHGILRKLIGFTSDVGARYIVDAAANHGSETHGQYLSERKLKPMAPIVYSPRAAQVRAQLWKETLAELSFANVEDIINGLK